MAAQYGSGLKNVSMGELAADGDVSTSFLEVGNTVQGSMQYVTEEGTSTPFNIEESSQPIKEIMTEGTGTLSWECYDISGENLAKLFGGTYDVPTKIYTAPAKVVAKELSVKLTSAEDHIVTFARMSVFPTFNWAFTKDNMAKVAIRATLLAPTKAGVGPFTVKYA